MRVALFGGSFNPPHMAHEMVALTVLETEDVDELWFVPCFKHPFDKELVSFEHRLRMCELAAAAVGPRAKVSDIERRLGGDSRTLRTVKALRAEDPALELSLVLGADLEAELGSWYGAEELESMVRVIVIGRSGFGKQPSLDGRLVMPAISSTDVRARLQDGRGAGGLVSRKVLEYIRERNLYG